MRTTPGVECNGGFCFKIKPLPLLPSPGAAVLQLSALIARHAMPIAYSRARAPNFTQRYLIRQFRDTAQDTIRSVSVA
jgi:hypothetical protein